MNKNLLFMLENGEEFIKGVYEANTKKVYFLSADEECKYEDVREYTKYTMSLFEENKIEIEMLINEILNDKDLISKIENHKSNKLMFRYNNLEFNKMRGL